MKITKVQLTKMIREAVKEQLNESTPTRILTNLETAMRHLATASDAIEDINLEIDAALEGHSGHLLKKGERHIYDAYRQLKTLYASLKNEEPPVFPHQTILTK